MDIYIVRHGETPANINKICGSELEDLTENGVRQAEELREKIKNMSFDIIYCSPFIRARHTAQIINSKNIEVMFDDRLSERSPGNLVGVSLNNTDREVYWDYYTDVKYGTEENIRDFFARVYNFLDELKNKKYNKVLVVAHSGVSKVFYAYFNGISKDGKFLKLGLKNGEIKQYKIL